MEESLLDLIRDSEEHQPSLEELTLAEMTNLTNEVNDVKAKLGVTNELLLEVLEVMKEGGCAKHGAQARPTRHIPPPSRLLTGRVKRALT